MTTPAQRTLLNAVLLAGWLIHAAESSCGQTAQGAGRPAPPDATLDIGGPAPPVSPAVIARAPDGRATVRITRVAAPLRIDGRLDEEVYGNVAAIDDFTQQEPDEGEPATERTEAWVLFDHENIYIAARCHESRRGIAVANELRRDSHNIYQNDNFGVILDTFHDRRNGFLFYTNPVGGIADSYVTDERETNRDWNTVWDVHTRRYRGGWSVEMSIPFRSLRYRPGNPQVWGINLRRIIRGKNEYCHLVPIPRSYGGRGFLKVSSAATLVGIEVPPEGASLELKPYALGAVKTDLGVDPPISNRLDANAGLDAKYGLTRGLTADFTYRTDFAQVEVDEQQVNLSRFSLFYPEKRDFFLEGAGIFSFGGVSSRPGFGLEGGLQSLAPIMFYSRRIGMNEGETVPIVGGARLTGKAGAYTIGALDIQAGSSREALAPATNFAVLRAKRDVLKRSSIGVIATNRTRTTSDTIGASRLLGFDGSLVLGENTRIDSYYARSSADAPAVKDASYRAAFDHTGDRYGLQLEHLAVGAEFRPDIGFLKREDFRRSAASARFSPRPKSIPSLRKVIYEGTIDYITDTQGRLETRQVELSTAFDFERGDFCHLSYERNREVLREPLELSDELRIEPGGYDSQIVRTGYYLGPQRRLSGYGGISYGGFYGGTRKEASFRGRMELSYRLSVEPGISFNRVDTPWGAFDPRLIGARVNYAFSPRMFLGALVQHNSADGTLATNVRFRWEYLPGSDLYVVYTEGRLTGPGGMPQTETRSFAVKFTRLFRF